MMRDIYVNMRDIYVNMQDIYVNMQHNYVNRPSASGDITLQGFPVTSGKIFWYIALEVM
jgi:hypothetical protein